MREEKTFETIMAEMMAEMPDGVNTMEGSLIWNACAKQALQMEEAYLDMQIVEDNMYADTQDEEHLIQNGADKGIPIKEPTKAIVRASILQESGAGIRIGTRFTANSLNYSVAGAIKGNEYKLECEQAGAAGNIGSGELVPIDFVGGYQGGEILDILVLGQEREDIELYRKKILDSVNASYFGGNRSDYERFIEELEGVGACKVKRREPEDKFIYPYILDASWGVPTDTLVGDVQGCVDPVQNHGAGDGIAPIGHFVLIKPATGVEINITAQFTFDDGYSQEDVQGHMEHALEEYFLELKKGWKNTEITVRLSQIEHRLLNVEGTIDIADTKLNGASSNIALGYAEVPVRGKINGI